MAEFREKHHPANATDMTVEKLVQSFLDAPGRRGKKSIGARRADTLRDHRQRLSLQSIDTDPAAAGSQGEMQDHAMRLQQSNDTREAKTQGLLRGLQRVNRPPCELLSRGEMDVNKGFRTYGDPGGEQRELLQGLTYNFKTQHYILWCFSLFKHNYCLPISNYENGDEND